MTKNSPIEARIEKMAQWAAGIEKQIADLQSKVQLSDHALADAISTELGDLYAQYSETSGAICDSEFRRIEIAHELKEINDSLEALAASEMLEVCAETTEQNGKTKLRYSNDAMRDNALKVRLATNGAYQEVTGKQRALELEAAIIKAQIADWERGLSEYRNRNRALVARLHNLTARLSYNEI